MLARVDKRQGARVIRFLFPLLPFRLAGIMVSTGWKGTEWFALSLFLGNRRIMFHHSARVRFKIVRVMQRYPASKPIWGRA
jgi:hypothetical protein